MIFLFKIIRRIFAVALLLIVVVPSYFAYSIWNEGHQARPVKSDAIVVLGAAQFNGVPSEILQARIDEAKKVYRRGLAPRIITVGANAKGDNFTEAGASRTALVAEKIAKSVLAAIPVGRDTLSSTVAYANYLKAHQMHSVIIATDPYHCYRAEAEAKDLGFTASCAPATTGPAAIDKAGWRYILRETGAYLAYKTVGHFGIHLTDQIKK